MIRFVMVNGRVPACEPFFCAACGDKIENGYIHEPQTHLKYCGTVCFQLSEKLAMVAIEHRARVGT